MVVRVGARCGAQRLWGFVVSIVDRTIVISVEPVPDDSPAPFALKPLVGTATDAGAGVSQDIQLNDAPLPTGAVSFR